MSDAFRDSARELERLFEDPSAETLTPERAEALQRGLRDDEHARELFDRLALASRELAPETDPRSDFERAIGEASFLAALDAQLEGERSHQGPAPENVIPLFSFRHGVGVLAAAAAAMLVWSVIPTAPSSEDDFQARGIATDETKSLELRAAVFCVLDDGERFVGPDEAPFGLVSCPRDAEIKLAVRASEPGTKHLAFFGVSASGTLTWYGPTPAVTTSLEQEVGTEWTPFGETIRLKVNHEPGPVRLYAIARDEPIEHAMLAGWLDSVDSEVLFDDPSSLPGELGTDTTSIRWEVLPEVEP